MRDLNITKTGLILRNKTVFLFCIFASTFLMKDAASQSLEDFVRGSHQKSGELAKSDRAGKSVPGYTEEGAHKIGSDISAVPDNELKDKANKRISDAKQGKGTKADEIMVEAMKKKPLDNLEDTAIFKKADKLYENPMASLGDLTDEKCKERVNEQRNQYTKQIRKEKKKDLEYEEMTCEKPNESISCENVLEVTCDGEAGGSCDGGGIVRGSVESDMQFTYSYPTLTIGTIADNNWGGNCAVYDRNTKFKIENLKDITEFRITEVGFDDYLWIKINGHSVYVGPDGGAHIELTTQEHCRQKSCGWFCSRTVCETKAVVTNGVRNTPCERTTNWRFAQNIDLKPYLREGENDIWIRVIVSGGGEGWMKITAKQFCCNKFKDTWTKKCRSN